MNYKDIITIEPNKHNGKDCIRGLRQRWFEMLLFFGTYDEQLPEDFFKSWFLLNKQSYSLKLPLVKEKIQFAKYFLIFRV